MMLKRKYEIIQLGLRTRDGALCDKELNDPMFLSRRSEITLSRRYKGEDYLGATTDYLGQRYRGKVSNLFYASGSDRN